MERIRINNWAPAGKRIGPDTSWGTPIVTYSDYRWHYLTGNYARLFHTIAFCSFSKCFPKQSWLSLKGLYSTDLFSIHLISINMESYWSLTSTEPYLPLLPAVSEHERILTAHFLSKKLNSFSEECRIYHAGSNHWSMQSCTFTPAVVNAKYSKLDEGENTHRAFRYAQYKHFESKLHSIQIVIILAILRADKHIFMPRLVNLWLSCKTEQQRYYSWGSGFFSIANYLLPRLWLEIAIVIKSYFCVTGEQSKMETFSFLSFFFVNCGKESVGSAK